LAPAASVNRDERRLVRRCLQQDQEAWTALVDQFATLVGTVIWRATGNHAVVEDLAQETFLRVFRGLPYFDGRSQLSTWIYTIAHRVAIDYLRQMGRLRQVMGDEGDPEAINEVPAGGMTPEDAVASEEMRSVVREQLEQLPDKYRLPLIYATIDGLDYESIGTALGVHPGSVKTLVFRARQMLKGRVTAVIRSRSGMRVV
jgi:RNA polymerase sigma-70 factor (ECF subfamily)